jgi:pyruvate formate-lyase/glycerol dehydratase family glycyl radical enzyme
MPPEITPSEAALAEYQPTQRVTELTKSYFNALPEICVERPWLVTDFSIKHGLFGKPRVTVLEKARLYRHVLEHRTAVVRHTRAVDTNMKEFVPYDRSLFAGSTTSHFKGVPIYPEFLALTLWPELHTVSKRAKNPCFITEADARKLNQDVFPCWIEDNITERGRKLCMEENLRELGKPNHAPEMRLLERLVFFLASKPECISHTIPDFSRAIHPGLRSLITQAQERRKNAKDSTTAEFYDAMVESMEGIIVYSKRLAEEARRLAAREADPTAKAELLALADIHSRVPEQAAKTFREGLTTVWICWTAVHLENANIGLSLGRLDQVLYDLYAHDIDSGALSVADAIELVCCLWLKIGDHVPAVPQAGEELFGGSGSNQAITIGGVDASGNDAVNHLTYVMLRATEMMRLRDPNLNARYYPGVHKDLYLRRLCQVNLRTGATPALHNDRAVIKALTSKGETIEQARDYGVIGCVEPGSNGRFYGHTGSLLLNLTSVLELTLFNGKHRHTGDELISNPTGDPAQFQTFDQFKQAFSEQATWMIGQCTRLNNVFGRTHQAIYPTPILSCLFEGPMQKGKDLIEGGATINSSGAAIIGFADVVDSLAAIEQLVFRERSLSMADFLNALKANYGRAKDDALDDLLRRKYEQLRARLRNPEKTPRYGNENSQADQIALWLVKLLDREFGAKENYRGGHYRVGYWTMTNHAGFGRISRATPNGRLDGENFTSGITPVSGVTPELPKALRSVASLPPPQLSNGVALNIKFTPEPDESSMLDHFVADVQTYFDPNGRDDGGMEIQFNVTTHKTFVEERDQPGSHPGLLVRVSGYTAYFKDLNEQMKDEIIERTEYNALTGRAVEF